MSDKVIKPEIVPSSELEKTVASAIVADIVQTIKEANT
jgi:hypothetical protein